MAIRDLLWACPECREAQALVPHAEGDVCEGCDLVFRRGIGSRIECVRPGGEVISRPAAEWVDRLPDMSAAVEAESRDPEAEVEARFALGTIVVRKKNEYFGRIEEFGPLRRGILSIGARGLRFQSGGEKSTASQTWHDHRRDWPPSDGRNATTPDRAGQFWTFEDITAIQASSSTLQLKFRGEPVVSFRFPGGSLRYWELRLQYAVQRDYEEKGRGKIREFQPRIVTR